MNITILLALMIFIILIGLVFILVQKKPRIGKANAGKYIQKIKQTQKLDPIHGIIECHKIFITAIEPIAPGRITAAKKIQKISNLLPNKKRIWYFHRMRNKAAHEADFKLSEKEIREAREIFTRALRSLS